MELTKIHKFNSKKEGVIAVNMINKAENIPNNRKAVTRTYCELQAYKDWFYIRADNITQKHIESVTNFEFTETKEL
jgi:hypothetical protein